MKKRKIFLSLLAVTATAATLASCKKDEPVEPTNPKVTIDGQGQVIEAENGKIQLPNNPTKEGYTFAGWYIDAACTKEFKNENLTEDLTIYAKWVINQYTVTFKDGEQTLSTSKVDYNNAVELPTLSKEGYTFGGWYTDAALTTQFVTNSIKSDITLYIKWTQDVVYTVTFDEKGGWTNTPNQVISKDEDGYYMVTQPTNPKKEYATFGGWYTDVDCTNAFDFSSDINSDITLYAKWNVGFENVTYNMDYVKAASTYPNKERPANWVTFGAFTFSPGVYFEDKNGTNDDAVNNQQNPFLFNVEKEATLSFDAKGGSTMKNCTLFKLRSGVTMDDVISGAVALDPSLDEPIKAFGEIGSSRSSYSANIEAKGIYYVWSTDGGSCGSARFYNLKLVSDVEVSAPVEIVAEPTQVDFLIGREFVAETIPAKLKYANGREDSIDAIIKTNEYNKDQAGVYTITVQYDIPADQEKEISAKHFEYSFEVNVYGVDSIYSSDFSLNSSRVTLPVQKVFISATNAEVKTDNLAVRAVCSIPGREGTKEFLLSAEEYSITKPDITSTGAKEVQISAFNKEVKYTVYGVTNPFAENESIYSVKVDPTKDVSTTTKNEINFKTINDALMYLSIVSKGNDAALKKIIVANGTYHEKVYVDMPNVMIGSENETSNVVIEYDALNGKKDPSETTTYSTDGAATFTVSKKAKNFTAIGITFKNYYNTNELYKESLKITNDTQATAVLVQGDMSLFYKCNFTGYHDTLYAQVGRQYYYDCNIEGRTDYIFGYDATAYFQDCTIKTLGAGLTEKNGGYVVATKGADGLKYGYIFNECEFTADSNTQNGSVSIARGWDSNMTVMVMNCVLGAHISNGTYGQKYYQTTVAEAEFEDLKSNLYVLDGEEYKKVGTAEFDSTKQYYKELNDRYTKMNAAPTASLLKEYNNTGAGALTYSEELATKFAALTCTLLNPESTDHQKIAASHEDLFEVFAGTDVNWNPQCIITNKNSSITFNGVTPTIAITHAYEGGTLTTNQLKLILDSCKEAVEKGYTVVGLYEDAEFKKEFTSSTILGKNTVIYVRTVQGTLEVKNLTEFDGTIVQKSEETTNAQWVADDVSAGNVIIANVAGKTALKPSEEANKVSGIDYVTANFLASGKVLTSPVITDEGIMSIDVTLYGATTDTGNSMRVELIAYDTEGNIVAKTQSYTPSGKLSGYLVDNVSGDQNKANAITLTSTTNAISYYTVQLTNDKAGSAIGTGDAQSKKFAFSSIKTKYEKITQSAVVVNKLNSQSITFSTFADIAESDMSSLVGADYSFTKEGLTKVDSNGIISILHNGKDKFSIQNDTSKKIFDIETNSLVSTKYRISTRGGSNDTRRCVVIDLTSYTAGQKVKFVSYVGQGGNDAATVKITESTYDGKEVFSQTTTEKNTMVQYSTILETGKKYILSTSQTLYIWGFNLFSMDAITESVSYEFKKGSYTPTTTNSVNVNSDTVKIGNTPLVCENVLYETDGSNGLNNWLKFNANNQITFAVSKACKVKVYFYNGVNNAVVSLNGTVVNTSTESTGATYTTAYEYTISAAGIVNILSNANGGYIGMLEIVYE